MQKKKKKKKRSNSKTGATVLSSAFNQVCV